MAFRFIHSSDLHLGKRFGNFDGDLPGRLREARHAVIGRLAGHARENGATTVLLAGDTFDSETPARDVVRQAMTEMRRHAPLSWVILPGNHDSLQAAQLWAALAGEKPDNVTLALEPRPLELAADVTLLPAPCTTRRPGRDLTDWMGSAETPEGHLRIGLAHGAVQSFTEDGVGKEVIAPDRAARAGLDYLALGDWHGAVEINARTRYSGAPEPDRFKHDRPGEALLVTLDGPGALPVVTAFETGSFSWRTLALDLLDGDDAAARLKTLLPDAHLRRQSLISVVATGRARLEGRTLLSQAIEDARPDFAYLEFDEARLATECEAGDLDRIDVSGALREAADALLAEADDESRLASEREVSRAALARLYAYSQGAGV